MIIEDNENDWGILMFFEVGVEIVCNVVELYGLAMKIGKFLHLEGAFLGNAFR